MLEFAMCSVQYTPCLQLPNLRHPSTSKLKTQKGDKVSKDRGQSSSREEIENSETMETKCHFV